MVEYEKGDSIGTVWETMSYTEAQGRPNNLNNRVGLTELDVDVGQQVFVSVALHQGNAGGAESIAKFTGKVHKTKDRITVPEKIIKDNDIQPGYTLRLDVYEAVEVETEILTDTDELPISDDSEVVARAEATQNQNLPDGVDSHLAAGKARRELDMPAFVEFKNTATGMRATGFTGCQSGGRGERIDFPRPVRETINASAGDLIEIRQAETAPSVLWEQLSDIQTKVNKIHSRLDKVEDAHATELEGVYSMVSDIHDAYLTQRND